MTWIAVRRHRMGTSTRRSCIQLPSVIKRRHWKWKKGKASEWESGENRLDGIAYSAFASIQITIKFQQCCVECNKKNFRFENKIKMEKRKEKSIQCLPAPFLFPSGRYFHCTQEEWQGKNRDWTNSKDFVNFGEWKGNFFSLRISRKLPTWRGEIIFSLSYGSQHRQLLLLSYYI